jgi:hypothetical protein
VPAVRKYPFPCGMPDNCEEIVPWGELLVVDALGEGVKRGTEGLKAVISY